MRSALLACLLFTACVDATSTDEIVAPDGDGKTDTATELRVRAGDTTLWITPTLSKQGDGFVLHGRTSRNLTGGNAFVNDDPYGDFAQASARTFDVTYGASEAGPLFEGTNLFVALTPSGADAITARLVVRPRVLASSGSSKIYLTAEVTPVIDDGVIVYRLSGHTTTAAAAISASAGAATMTDTTHFQIDLALADLTSLPTIDVTATIGASNVVRHAQIGLAVKKLGLTTGDAYDQWPSPTCTTTVKTCLGGLPTGTLDTASCGDAITVRACEGVVGASVDSAALGTAIANVDATVATMNDDATQLVGADHASAFVAAVKADAEASVQALGGHWYPAAATRDAQLAAAETAPIDEAYARPLDLVAAHAPAPGDAAGTRQVVADALLAYLGTQDYLHSEFSRTLEQLAKEFRAQHVHDVGAMRTTEDLFRDPSMPGETVYIGSWLGTHVEVTIEDATGVASHVLVELD